MRAEESTPSSPSERGSTSVEATTPSLPPSPFQVVQLILTEASLPKTASGLKPASTSAFQAKCSENMFGPKKDAPSSNLMATASNLRASFFQFGSIWKVPGSSAQLIKLKALHPKQPWWCKWPRPLRHSPGRPDGNVAHHWAFSPPHHATVFHFYTRMPPTPKSFLDMEPTEFHCIYPNWPLIELDGKK